MKRHPDTLKADLAVFAGLLVFFFLTWLMRAVVTPFILAAIFSYALNPVIEKISGKVPRGLSIGFFVMSFFLLLCGIVAGIIYILRLEIPTLVANIPGYAEVFDREYFPVIRQYLGLGADVTLQGLFDQAKDQLLHLSAGSYASAASYALSIVAGTLNIFLAIFNVFLIPFLMVYILLDYGKVKEGANGLLPPLYKEDILAKLREVEQVLRSFVKGQLLVALIMGVMYCIGLFFVGVDVPILVGLGAGLGNLVPYLGTSLGLIVSIILVLLKYHDLLHPAMVVGVFVLVQIIEGYVITPKIVGKTLGLNPLVVIFSILVFGELVGFLGIVLAVPIAAVLKVFLTGFIKSYKQSALFIGKA
ncbi:MAG TPA: AI-2E family transporter [Nitrospirota bacterium]